MAISNGQERPDLFLVEAGAQLVVHDAPTVDDQKPVRQVERKAQHLLGNDNRETALLPQHVERLSQVLDERRLKAFSWLVQKQDLGVRNQRACDG